ncbi:hypothetical protein BASA81_003766 [Batrachochytrium salamandrivorans]|nr:hypothetical protein BASA81_003766 [Batrachochytrium salamandrivorans]
MCLSLFGCCASKQARRDSKCFIFIYILLLVGCICLQVAALVLASKTDGLVATQQPLVSGTLVSQTQIDFNNALMSTFVACCYGCTSLGECNNALPYFDKLLDQCWLGGVIPACLPVVPCLTATQNGCFKDGQGKFPTHQIDQGVCTELAKIEFEGSQLVGSSPSGGCGAGSPEGFASDVTLAFAGLLYYVQIAMGVLLGLQVFNLFVALYVCRHEGREFTRGEVVAY